jgi:hypothetical protein
MSPEFMFQSENPSNSSYADILQLWPQARGELLGFALALSRKNAEITAKQLHMAVQLADQRFAQLKEGKT